jgi:hypothetical protein
MTKLAICTPVRASDPYSAHVTVGYSEFRLALQRALPIEEISHSVSFCTDIVRARNRIAAHVLRELEDVTHVFWLDDDEWADDAGLVRKMLDTGEDFISAPYSNKKKPVRWVHQFLNEKPEVKGDRLEVRGVGMGFTLISRHCLQRLSNAAETYWDLPNHHQVANIFGQLYDEAPTGQRMLLSEDFSCCKRWRDLGGKVMIYAGAGNIVNHAGPYAFSARDIEGGVK